MSAGALFSVKNSFTAGELSPQMLGRADLRAYEMGASELTNVYVSPTGGLARRPGLRLIAEAEGSGGRLAEYADGAGGAYLLHFGHLRVDAYDAAGDCLATLASPWPAEALPLLSWAQADDGLVVAHSDYPMRRISRAAGGSWSLALWEFSQTLGTPDQPYANFHRGQVRIMASAATGAITLTATAAVFSAAYIGLCLKIHGGIVQISQILSPTAAYADVLLALSAVGLTPDWGEPAFSTVRGWPAAVAAHQSRFVIGGSRGMPSHLWLSRTGQPRNFNVGQGLDDEAIDFSLAAGNAGAVCAVASGRYLQVFTTEAEYMVCGEPLTPSAIQVRRQTAVGSVASRRIPPRDIDGATVFVGAGGRELREFLFADTEQAYQAANLSMMSGHMLDAPVDQEYDSRRRLLYVINAGGEMAVLTNYRTEQITAWTRWTTDGQFLAAASVGGLVYALVAREGSLFIERFDDSLGADCTGGEGEGLPYAHIVTPLPPSSMAGQVRAARLVRASFRVVGTASLRVDTGTGLRQALRGDLDSPQTVDAEVRSLGWRRGLDQPLWRIWGDEPSPFVLVSVSSDIRTAG
ncbi:hypothetical protein FACS1894186_3230 [Alphaproteobacteria bacterium]|nr:hypothetical protein FACS1894186_3230 [Alphaproteobacteria bacterium]